MAESSSKLTSVEVLEKALELLGPNGENWVNEAPDWDKHCCVTAIDTVGDNRSQEKAKSFLRRVINSNVCSLISRWNDAPERTFPEVRAAFLKAIELAKAEQEAAHV